MISLGLHGEAHLTVEHKWTAAALGNGSVEALATPYMISLIELASINAVAAVLAPGQTTVGTLLNVTHLAATPVGMNVTATAHLVEVDSRRLVFDVEAYDEQDKIGEGRHERFVVDQERFLERLRAKAAR